MITFEHSDMVRVEVTKSCNEKSEYRPYKYHGRDTRDDMHVSEFIVKFWDGLKLEPGHKARLKKNGLVVARKTF